MKKYLLVTSIIAMVFTGCSPLPQKKVPDIAKEKSYFKSPREAVDLITTLIKNQDWLALCAYYDLSGSAVKREELLSGGYFIREKRPDVAHPGGFWRYKHPFAPGFNQLTAGPIWSPKAY